MSGDVQRPRARSGAALALAGLVLGGWAWLALPIPDESEDQAAPELPTSSAAGGAGGTARAEDAVLGTDAGSSPNAAAEPSPAEIALPPPYGTVPRERPVQTVWLVAPDALDVAGDVVGYESGLVVEYMATYGISGDGLALGLQAPRRVQVGEVELLAALDRANLADVATAADFDRGARTLTAYPDDHHAVIAVTSDASPWRDQLDEQHDLADATSSFGSPELSMFVIELTPGSGTTWSTVEGPLPAVVSVDPDVPGAVAHTLARAWVQSYRGGWRDDRTQ